MARPRKIKTPAEFDKKVDAYVAVCVENEEPVTWTGMALSLGFSNRQAMDNYAEYPEFLDSVKRAKGIVEREYERRLFHGNAAGPIFALKNMGWRDKQDHEHTGPGGGPVRFIVES